MPIKKPQPINVQRPLQELPANVQLQPQQLQHTPETSRLPTPIKSPAVVRSIDSGPLVVQIPKPSPNFRRDDFSEVPDPNKRRKLSHDDSAVEVPLRVRSQREASDAVLLQFQNSLMEVFEAQDQLDAGSTNAQDAGFFDVVDDGDSTEPRLSLKTLERLQTSLKKLVDLQRMQDVSVEHLRRLQRLCEPAVDYAQTVNLRLTSEHSADDQEHWRQKLTQMETGVVSSSICIYTMIGCPHEEVLLLSDVRMWIPNVIVNLFENCLIPVVESRADSDADFFATATLNKTVLRRLLDNGRKLLNIMTTLCTDTKGSAALVNPVEFLCAKLIFVQNANTDKNSCLGIQSYEKVRQTAMSCLARIYARFPSERRTILDEILTSVDKLPSNSRSARQYRLGDGKSVQLITALFVQLVQTTSLEIPSNESKANRKPLSKNEKSSHNSDEEDEDEMNVDDNTIEEGPVTRLQAKADTLFEASVRSAQDIVSYLVSRASKTTKTGDSPYRNVLDLFIEDLVAMLPSPEWPASELMLRMLSRFMINLANNDKSAATKNMALESLGVMGSAISELKASVPDLASVLERDTEHQSEVSKSLCRLAAEQEASGGLQPESLLFMEGPFALVTRQLSADTGYSLQSRSACGFFIAHYAKLLTLSKEAQETGQDDIEAAPTRVANWLLDLIPKIGTNSIDTHKFDPVNTEEAELAYALCVLNVGFCSGLYNIGRTLTASFTSDQAQVRTRSLKSVQTMLEKDASLMNNDSIVDSVFICAADDSALVRDAALSLIAKFIVSRPRLRKKGIQRLLECASDSKVGVQKKSMIHLKDVYLNDNDKALRTVISRTFLERIKDHEEAVADLAKKTLLELWISPTIQSMSDSVESKRKIAVENLSQEIVQCVTTNSVEMSGLLQKFLLAALSDTRAATGVRKLCSGLVEALFEKIISGGTEYGSLETLAAFAAADSQLIPPSRLAKLKHYLTNIKTDEDLYMFKSVINIFRSVLPGLSATHRNLLSEIQVDLLKSISSLGRRIDLDPVMTCLWTIEGVLCNPARLVNLTASVFLQIKNLKDNHTSVARLLRIAGAIARHMDLDSSTAFFASRLKAEVQGGAISTHMASLLLEYTKSSYPLEIRVSAFESLGSLCQANPVFFNRPSIRKTLFSAFDEASSPSVSDALRHIVLCLFDELYASRAQTKEESEDLGDKDEEQDLSKLGGNSKTRDGDSAIVSITSEVVQRILEVALNTHGDDALLATRTLASISHEGLIHPKQSTGAFVALGTSSDVQVAEIASTAQRLLHQTHESVCEREYMQSIQQAFTYQDKVFNDTCGARSDGYSAKLAGCFEIVNMSNAKYVKKFLSGLVTRIANDLAAQDKKGHTRRDVEFARFVLQNIAFFEYKRLDDLLHTVLQLELAYSKSGGEVIQQLETNTPLEPGSNDENQTRPANPDFAVDGGEVSSRYGDLEIVHRLAPTAATLTLLMETRAYLRRQYGVGQDVRAAISTHKQLKDSNKSLVKVHGITGERIWTRTNSIVASLDTDKDMIACCKNFVALMNVAEADVEQENSPADERIDAPVVHTNGFARASTPGARKRKGSVSAGSTPVKKARGRPRKEVKRSASVSSMEDPEADFDG